MARDSLLTSQEGRIRVLTLNRPDQLNALNTELRHALSQAFQAVSRDPEVGALVLTGVGDRAFCAGQDLGESANLDPARGPQWMATWKDYFKNMCACSKPIVAALNGVAAGAGLQTALLADIRLGVPHARLVMSEVDVGLPAITGAFLLAQHLGYSRSMELVLTGRSMSAEEGREIGLTAEIVEPSRLYEHAIERAEELASKPPCAMALTLMNLRRQVATGMDQAEDAAIAYQSEAISTGEPQKLMATFLQGRRQRRPVNTRQ